MEFPKTTSIVLISISCLLLSTTIAVATPIRPNGPPCASAQNSTLCAQIVNATCESAKDPTTCAETIAPYVTGPLNSYKELEASLNATREKAMEIIGTIDKLQKDPTITQGKVYLRDCWKLYDFILDSIKKVEDGVRQHNLGDIGMHYSSMMAYKSYCEDGGAPGDVPTIEMPFRSESEKMANLGALCLNLANRV